MRNYAINNIMSYRDEICYICSTEQNILWVTNQYGTSSVGKKRYILDDVELSDWFFNQLFEDKRGVDTWMIAGSCNEVQDLPALVVGVDTWMIAGSCNIPDKPLYWIKKETEGVYLFQRMIKGRTVCYFIDSVRVFQNLYNFYREYDEWAECLVEIDERIKEIFKVV